MKSFFALMFSIIAFFLNAQEYTFRGLPFGTTKNDFILKEGSPSSNVKKSSGAKMVGDEFIFYDNVVVAGHDASMQIEFLENKMIAGSYLLKFKTKLTTTGFYDPINASKIYHDLKDKLTQLYGKPSKDFSIERIDGPVSGIYAQEISDAAPYQTKWDYLDGLIMLNLSYTDQWTLNVIYISPEIYNKMKEMDSSKTGL